MGKCLEANKTDLDRQIVAAEIALNTSDIGLDVAYCNYKTITDLLETLKQKRREVIGE
jgi:hypothetical protein